MTTMTHRPAGRIERLGYVAGAVFPVAVFAGISLEEQGRTFPEFEDGAISTAVLREVFATSGANRIGAFLSVLGMVLLVWFAGALYVRSTRMDERSRPAATGLLIGAAVFAVVVVAIAGTGLVAQYDAELVDPAVLLAWYSAMELSFGMFLAAFLAASAMLGAIAYLGFAHGVIPRWAAWPAAALAAVMGVGSLLVPIAWGIGFIAWLAFLAFMIWSLAVSIRLAIRPDTAATAAGRTGAPPDMAAAVGAA